MNLLKKISASLLCVAAIGAATSINADKLDDVIKSGTLNCGVVLDFPPMGYFDKNNKAAGFDVDYCKDLGKTLGVKTNILNLTWGDRIPSLISGKTDVVIGSTSDTLERAKSVGFTYPYFVFKFQVISKKDKNIYKDVIDLRGKLSIRESLYVLSKAKLTISNDSAIAHMSRAVNTKVLMIYGATHPYFGFYPLEDEGDYLFANLSCQPCDLHGKKECKFKNYKCFEEIKPKFIVEKAFNLL